MLIAENIYMQNISSEIKNRSVNLCVTFSRLVLKNSNGFLRKCYDVPCDLVYFHMYILTKTVKKKSLSLNFK